MKFFCTCGRGTEVFVALEIYSVFKSCVSKINVTDGKVFFEITDRQRLRDVLSLKFCERIFMAVVRSVGLRISNNKQGFSTIRFLLNGISSDDWTESIKMLENLRQNDKSQDDNDDDNDEPKRKKTCNRITTFRVSAKCSGRLAKFMDQKTMSCMVGQQLTSKSSLTVDLRHPDVEVFFHLNNDGLVIGIPCSSRPLSERSFLKHNGLRSTVASILVSLSGAKAGMTLLDPMCGNGILLLEAASMHKDTVVIGCDINRSSLEKAGDNVSRFLSMKPGFIQLMHCNAKAVPFESSCVDAVVCDVPFGIKHSLVDDMKSFLTSVDRLLVPGGKCILLGGLQTTKQLLELVKKSFTCDEASSTGASVTTRSTCERGNLSKLMRQILRSSNRLGELEGVVDSIESSIDVSYHTRRLLGIADDDDEDDTTAASDDDDDDDNDDGEVMSDGRFESGVNPICKSEDRSDGSADGKGVFAGEVCSKWRKELIHYLKLGETDSFVCVFRKMK